jgi:hypothetical protein
MTPLRNRSDKGSETLTDTINTKFAARVRNAVTISLVRSHFFVMEPYRLIEQVQPFAESFLDAQKHAHVPS